MDIDRLAAMRAKQRNRKIAKKYPLFAEQFATTPEQEKERIIRQRKNSIEYFDNLKELNRKAWERGLMYRKFAELLLPNKDFEQKEMSWRKWKPNALPETNGFDLADYWFSALKGTEFAAQNCPNRDKHDDPQWWKPHWNFLTNSFSETTECPTCGLKRAGLAQEKQQ